MPNLIDQISANTERFKAWRERGEWEGVPLVGQHFIEHVLGPNFPRPLYGHQKEAIIRAIFAFEVLGFKDILLNIVTGGGKTLIIAALAAYMRQVHDVHAAIILAPNTIVRDRLKKDFDPASKDYVYKRFPFYFNSHAYLADRLEAVTLAAERGATSEQIRRANVIVANIHQLYERSPNLGVLEAGVQNLVVFNDEAHNSVAPEWARVLARLVDAGKRILRVDTTATPERLDGNNPGSSKVYDYRVRDALRDRVIKQVVVCQPDVVSVEYEVYEVDEETGKRRVISIEDVPWDELERRKQAKEFSTRQYVTSEKTVRSLAGLAYDALRIQRMSADDQGWKPIMFVVTISIEDAKSVKKVLEDREFAKRYNGGRPYRVHLVTKQSEEEDRAIVMRLGDDMERPEVDVVVSVAMLREGWDVKNVGVILLLRRFTCRWVDDRPMSTFGPQTIGRGLRRVKPPMKGGEWERCLVIDHPILEHHWLWDELGADVIAKKFGPSDTLEINDMPAQPPEELEVEAATGDQETEMGVAIELPPLPPPIEPMQAWREFLREKTYEKTGTNVRERIRDIKKRTLDPERGGMTTITKHEDPGIEFETPSMQEASSCPDAATCRQLIYDEISELAKQCSGEFGGGAPGYKLFHAIVEEHVREKFFRGQGVEAEKRTEYLEVVLRHYLPQVREVFQDPEVLHGIWQDTRR